MDSPLSLVANTKGFQESLVSLESSGDFADMLERADFVIVEFKDNEPLMSDDSSITTDSVISEVEKKHFDSSPTAKDRYCFCPFDVSTDKMDGPHVCKGEGDKECEAFMQNLIEIIFSSCEKIDQETSSKFDEYCKFAAGRRHFAELLNQRRVRDKLVEEETFYRLVQFCAICLFECHLAEDFTPATTLMNMCFTFCHDPKALSNGSYEEDGTMSFLYTHLQDQHIWKSMRFWDVAFLTAMHQERTRWNDNMRPSLISQDDINELDEMEENTTFGQLGTILHNMRELNIPKEDCLRFLEKTSAIGNLKPDHSQLLLEIVNQPSVVEGIQTRERTSSNASRVGKLFKNAFSVRKKTFKKHNNSDS